MGETAIQKIRHREDGFEGLTFRSDLPYPEKRRPPLIIHALAGFIHKRYHLTGRKKYMDGRTGDRAVGAESQRIKR